MLLRTALGTYGPSGWTTLDRVIELRLHPAVFLDPSLDPPGRLLFALVMNFHHRLCFFQSGSGGGRGDPPPEVSGAGSESLWQETHTRGFRLPRNLYKYLLELVKLSASPRPPVNEITYIPNVSLRGSTCVKKLSTGPRARLR